MAAPIAITLKSSQTDEKLMNWGAPVGTVVDDLVGLQLGHIICISFSSSNTQKSSVRGQLFNNFISWIAELIS